MFKGVAAFLGFFTVAAVTSKNIVDLGEEHWILQNPSLNISVPGSVPSHAHLDLLEHKVIDEPTYGLGDLSLRWIATASWTYISPAISGIMTSNDISTYLVFNGIDTFANISFCDQSIGTANNQFRQWTYDVTSILSVCTKPPAIALSFASAPAMANYLGNPSNPMLNCSTCFEIQFEFTDRLFIRKEQSDFGWDWGPAFAPAGIWQPAYIIQLKHEEIYVLNSMADIYHRGQVNNLPPDQTEPWIINASVNYLGILPDRAGMRTTIIDATKKIFLSGPLSNVIIANGTITGDVLVDKNPSLWWPVGHRDQNLYDMTLEIVDNQNKSLASVRKRIGFRTIVLNQGVITNEQSSQGIAPGANWHFEINGREIFCKGSNLVPLDPFWPRVTKSDMEFLIKSAIAGNQNMLRVWASGNYLPGLFYDLADQYGLLLWSEFQFSDALYPTVPSFLSNIREEVHYHVRRINHHPSLALWTGNNEIEFLLDILTEQVPEQAVPWKQQYEKLFLDVILHAVYDNTRSISYSPSSTTNGYISLNPSAPLPMVERYNNLSVGSIYGDSDYYNYDPTQAFNISSYPIARFVNEFGFHSQPSYQTWSSSIPASELHFNSSTILSRNHHYPLNTSTFITSSVDPPVPENQTERSLGGMGQISQATLMYFPVARKSDPRANFTAQIYTTQIFQSEFDKSQIAAYRRGSGQPQRTLGALYWQLNDIWAAPTWSSLEVSGRWKLLHYGARDIFKPVIIAPYFDAPSGTLEVWVTSDLWEPINGSATLRWYDWSGKALANETKTHVQVGPINSTSVWTLNTTALSFALDNAVAILSVDAAGQDGKKYNHTHPFYPIPFSSDRVQQHLHDPKLRVSYSVEQQTFTIESQAVAAWVWLEHPVGVRGYFTDNGFWMLPGKRDVQFVTQRDGTNGEWVHEVTVSSLWDLTQP